MTLYENVNHTSFTRSCLLKYITVPFSVPIIYHRHQNMWQVPKIAEIIGSFGYNVDVINFDERQAHFNKKYDLLFDIYPQNHAIYDHYLTDPCIKILYSTGSAPSWQNQQEFIRIEALNRRKHCHLSPKAHVPDYDNYINTFDALFLIGNQNTLQTYQYAKIKKQYLIKNSAYLFEPLNTAAKLPNMFLFFATYPQVLKGLDLLLDVVAKNKQFNLVVCSQFQSEQDFCKLYDQELFHSPNILPVGPVDVTANVFQKIRQICSYVILPSCSEGMSGSVLTAMSAGLVPIISSACGLNSSEANLLDDCSLECIEQTMHSFCSKSLDSIQTESIRAANTIQSQYSPAQFEKSLQDALQSVLVK